MHDMDFLEKMKMVAKGISQDDFPENGVRRQSNRSLRMRTMTVLGSSQTHSPRRVVSYFYRHFGSVFSITTGFVLKMIIFLIHGLGKCEESVRTRDMGMACRHSSRITYLLECVFTLEHCICT